MAERLSILSQRVDDIPLLLAQLERMGVRSLLDEYFPAHGHWVGLSLGWVAALNDRGRGTPWFPEPPALQAAVEALLTRYRVQGLLAVHDTDPVQERLLRRDGSRPPTVRVERAVQVTAVADRHAVAGAIRPLGWRV